MKKLSINLVIHNEEKYIPFLVDSLASQQYKDFSVLAVDNASSDKTAELLGEGLAEHGIECTIITQNENLGFAGGHNIAYQNTKSRYLLLLNPDIFILPDVLAKMVEFMDQHGSTASLAPRLMRWDFDKVNSAHQALAGFSKMIDALGIRLYHNRRAIEMFSGLPWTADSSDKNIRDLYNKRFTEVFGVSGAMVMYRKDILDKVALPDNNIFDPFYHSYKEDLDLAYRLRNAGQLSYVLLDAVSYHDRTSASPVTSSDLAAIKNKRRQSEYIRYHSYKNHLATLYKNEYWQNVALDWPFILWFELRKAGYILLTSPKIFFKCWWTLFKNRRHLRSGRERVIKSRTMYWKGIRRWF